MSAVSHDIHVDMLLSEMALNYRPEGFIADMVMPIVRVGKQSDLYVEFSREDKLRQQETKRAPSTEAKMIHQNVGSASYYANNYALKMGVTLEDKLNADPIFLTEIIEGRTEFILDHLLLDWEVRVAGLIHNPSNVGSSSSVSSAWNVAGGGGDPIGDVNQALDNVHLSNGIRPNRITFGLEAWKSIRRHESVRNIIFGVNNGGGFASREQVANLFEVDQVLVGGAFQNTGEEGLTESLSAIWGDDVLISYSPMTASKEKPSFAYSFRWQKPGLPNFTVERHPFNTKTKSEEVEAGYYQDEVITGASYGYMITSVNSSQ